eukprot:6175178-Pleurochrysis_carterae.AAC.1
MILNYVIADDELDTTDEAVTEDEEDHICSEEEGGEVGDEDDGQEEDEEVGGVDTGGQGDARHAEDAAEKDKEARADQ